MDGSKTGPATGSVLVRLRALRPGLSPAETRVGDLVLQDPRGVAEMTITQLADAAATSETSVLRFARRLGFKGYPGLRLALAQAGADTARPVLPSGDITPDDTVDEIIGKVSGTAANAVEETADQLDRAALARAASAIAASRRTALFGVTSSALVTEDLQQKLRCTGLWATASADIHQALSDAAQLGRDDVAVAVSHTGTTSEAVEFLEAAARRGATTVAITNFPQSPLGRVAGVVLTTAADETPMRSGAAASRVAALVVVDCLFMAVAQQRFDQTVQSVVAMREAVRTHHRRSR